MFSHTNRKGQIIYGNDIFVRVSDFTFEELKGKPHSIIRHPDMPKAVFKTMWDTILENRSIVAYVKNKSKTGKFYWVLALVVPFQEGFLSIRIKPSSNIFKKIPELYEELLEIEKSDSMEASVEVLRAAITDLGFDNYEEFMVAAFAKEMKSWNQNLSSSTETTFLEISDLLEQSYLDSMELVKASERLQKEFGALKVLCMNMLIHSQRLGDVGSAMAVTFKTFGEWGDDIKKILESFHESQLLFMQACNQSRLALGTAFMQDEMVTFFKKSDSASQEYIQNLSELSSENKKFAENKISELSKTFEKLVQAIKKLNESLMVFKFIKLNSKIEASHLPGGMVQMETTLEGTTSFITALETNGQKIKSQSDDIKKIIEKIKTISF
ncbi:MAG: PAS domain-containing protein [Bdellovibrionales bacterium]